MAHKVKLGIFICFCSFFLMSQNSYAAPIDLSNSNNISVNGFCANNVQYYSSALYYTPSSVSMDYYITRSFTDNGFNQFLFDSAPCSGAWGINSIDLYMDDNYGWEVDGKYLNVDIVSNNYFLPFYNGAVVYTFDGGNVVPGLIDSRTYDIKLQYSAYDWVSGRDQSGAEYGYKYDEVEVFEGVPSLQNHLQFSIPYIAENFTSNGVSNISMGTSQFVGSESERYQRFGYTSSPFFYTEDYNVSSSTMFWVYISVSDEPEFTSGTTADDQWASTNQYYNDNYAAVDNIAGLGLNDINAGDSSGVTNLIGQIGSFFDQVKNVQPDNSCSIPANFGHLNLGNISLCTGKENMPWVVTFGAYAFQIIWVVSISLLIIRQVLDVLDWGRGDG